MADSTDKDFEDFETLKMLIHVARNDSSADIGMIIYNAYHYTPCCSSSSSYRLGKGDPQDQVLNFKKKNHLTLIK